MNLTTAYNSLMEGAGYSFVVTKEGHVLQWHREPLASRKYHGQRFHVIPGSFNPLHETHREFYRNADCPEGFCYFELSVERMGKEMLTLPELGKRLEQFRDFAPVIVTRAPRFIEKIGTLLQHMNKVQFHVGVDTIARMADDYGSVGIQGLAAKFTVYDRIVGGQHKSLYNLDLVKTPKNCEQADVQRTQESLGRSSTSLRGE